ncbi:MAG: response regulator [Campylobacteraceae bacterium]|nr:response regulator [Campylobacteraceae bacterium]
MDRTQIKNSLKNLSVLFVDDEEIVIDIMQDILPMLFKNSYYARDGIEGIEQFKQNKPDIIITDISMPHLDGISMLKVIKKIDQNVKIIFLSGHNEQDQIDACKDLNGEFIIKPISSNILYQALGKVISA